MFLVLHPLRTTSFPRREVDREIGYYADKEDAFYMKKDLQAKPHKTVPPSKRHTRSNLLCCSRCSTSSRTCDR